MGLLVINRAESLYKARSYVDVVSKALDGQPLEFIMININEIIISMAGSLLVTKIQDWTTNIVNILSVQ